MATANPPVQFEASAFRVEVNGISTPGVTRVRGLRRSITVIEFKDGADPTHVIPVPGVTILTPLILWRPRTLDTSFDDWSTLASTPAPGPVANLRREVVIDLLNAARKPLLRYRVVNCWPSQYDAFKELLATSATVLMERLTLQHEGWTTEVLAP